MLDIIRYQPLLIINQMFFLPIPYQRSLRFSSTTDFQRRSRLFKRIPCAGLFQGLVEFFLEIVNTFWIFKIPDNFIGTGVKIQFMHFQRHATTGDGDQGECKRTSMQSAFLHSIWSMIRWHSILIQFILDWCWLDLWNNTFFYLIILTLLLWPTF